MSQPILSLDELAFMYHSKSTMMIVSVVTFFDIPF